MKKTVHLKITTTFVTYKDYEVEEELTDEEILQQANNDGDFLEDVLDTLDIDTQVDIVKDQTDSHSKVAKIDFAKGIVDLFVDDKLIQSTSAWSFDADKAVEDGWKLDYNYDKED